MQFQPLQNPLIFIPAGIVIIFDYLSLILYFRFLKFQDRRKLKYLILFKPISTAICIYFMFTQFGAGFFLGSFYGLLTPVVAIILLIFYIIQLIRFWKILKLPIGSYMIRALGGLLILISIVFPSFAYLPIKYWCATSNSKQIPQISEAMQAYLADMGEYPTELDELTPTYLSKLPVPACNFLSGTPRAYYVQICKGSEPMFYTSSVDLMGFDLYSFGDGNYSSIWSFLDNPDPGYCPE